MIQQLLQYAFTKKINISFKNHESFIECIFSNTGDDAGMFTFRLTEQEIAYTKTEFFEQKIMSMMTNVDSK